MSNSKVKNSSKIKSKLFHVHCFLQKFLHTKCRILFLTSACVIGRRHINISTVFRFFLLTSTKELLKISKTKIFFSFLSFPRVNWIEPTSYKCINKHIMRNVAHVTNGFFWSTIHFFPSIQQMKLCRHMWMWIIQEQPYIEPFIYVWTVNNFDFIFTLKQFVCVGSCLLCVCECLLFALKKKKSP